MVSGSNFYDAAIVMLISGRPHLPEHFLLRDTLYLLQGISGKYIRLSVSDDDPEQNKLVFVEDLVSTLFLVNLNHNELETVSQKHIISGPTKVLIHRLSEVGHLYTRVEAFVRDREAKSGVGMIEQSLCHHLQGQLTEYYRLVAVLESQMSDPPHSGGHKDGGDGERAVGGGEETGLTLKRLDVWINEWRLRMRMMSVCVEGARGNLCCFSVFRIDF
jgi:gamma-tubulin complex component 3